jgi:hypothetical protein
MKLPLSSGYITLGLFHRRLHAQLVVSAELFLQSCGTDIARSFQVSDAIAHFEMFHSYLSVEQPSYLSVGLRAWFTAKAIPPAPIRDAPQVHIDQHQRSHTTTVLLQIATQLFPKFDTSAQVLTHTCFELYSPCHPRQCHPAFSLSVMGPNKDPDRQRVAALQTVAVGLHLIHIEMRQKFFDFRRGTITRGL